MTMERNVMNLDSAHESSLLNEMNSSLYFLCSKHLLKFITSNLSISTTYS
jgi:hypothetical protein